jgi:WD40 repeat protein
VTAHQGRVNALCFDATRQLLMSGSHDGTLHCWSFDLNAIHHKGKLVVDRIATYGFQDGKRITALICFKSERANPSYMNVIAGTQNGSIHFLSMVYSVDLGKHEIVQGSDISINDCEPNANGPTINALCYLHANNSSHPSFIVGHSRGIGIVQLHDSTERHS